MDDGVTNAATYVYPGSLKPYFTRARSVFRRLLTEGMTTSLFSCLTIIMIVASSVQARLNDANGSPSEANAAADSVRTIADNSGTLLSSAEATHPCRSAFAVAPQPIQTGAVTMEDAIPYTPNPMFGLDDLDTPFDVQPVPEPSTWIGAGIAALVMIVHFLRNCEAMRRCNRASATRFAHTSGTRAIPRPR
jgi:hypothetical protein